MSPEHLLTISGTTSFTQGKEYLSVINYFVIMSSLNLLSPCIMGIVIALLCTKAFIYCNIIIPGGTVTFSDFGRLKYQVDVSEIDGKPAQSSIACINLCAADDSCSMVHYQHNTKKCMIDTRIGDVMLECIPDDNTLRSYVRHRYVCDGSWTLFDRSCYHVSPDYHAWTFCRAYCERNGSNLSSIRSDREMDFVSGILPILPLNDKYIHLGGTCYQDNTWRWVNGEPWDYTKWGPQEPTNVTGESYLAVFHHHAMVEWKLSGWADIQNYQQGYCLCEKTALINLLELMVSCLK